MAKRRSQIKKEDELGFTELQRVSANGSLVLFAGSGVSTAAGLPDRVQLVEHLVQRAKKLRFDPTNLRVVLDYARRTDYDRALMTVKEILSNRDFVAEIRERYRFDNQAVPELVHAITRLGPRLKAILTNNIDRVLEVAFGGDWRSVAHATADLAQRDRFILKLRGTIEDSNTWRLTREEFEQACEAPPSLKIILHSMLRTHHFLFIGCMPEDDIFAELAAISRSAKEQPPQHFCILPKRHLPPHQRRRLEEMGVRILTTFDEDETHQEAVRLLRRLSLSSVVTADAKTQARALTSLAEWLQDDLAATRLRVDQADREPDVEQRAGLVQSALQHFENCIAQRILWLPDLSRSGALCPVVLAILRDGTWLAALPAPPNVRDARQVHWIRLVVAIKRYFLRLRLYDAAPSLLEAIPGSENISLRALIFSELGLVLRQCAERCISAWSELDELQFIEGRALLGKNLVQPTLQALKEGHTQTQGILLLGNFGAGKSTQLRRQASKLAECFLRNSENEPAPVYLPMAGMLLSVPDLLAHHIPAISAGQFELAVRLGFVIPIFDGLDEVRREARIPSELLVQMVSFLNPADTRAKFVISARETLFTHTQQIRKVCDQINTSVVTLLALSDEEVVEFVGKRAATEAQRQKVLAAFNDSRHLAELARRPALLGLLVTQYERLSSGTKITTAQLYGAAAEEWLSSRRAQEHSIGSRRRLAFARALARSLFLTGAESVPYSHFANLVIGLLGAESASVSLDVAVQEVQSAVFLTHGHADQTFRFAHKPFLEYFLAIDTVERMKAMEHEALDLPRLPAEVIHLMQELPNWHEQRSYARSVLEQEYRSRVSENALFLLYHAASHETENTDDLRSRLFDDVPGGVHLDGAQLAYASLPFVSLRNADLSKSDLTGTDLHSADLRDAILCGVQASKTILDDAILDGANLQNANMHAASLIGTRLARVQWDGARVDTAIWCGTEPRNAWCTAGQNFQTPTFLPAVFDNIPPVAIWAPDDSSVFIARDSHILVVDPEISEPTYKLTVPHSGPIHSLAFAPSGQVFASGGEDAIICLWDLDGSHCSELHGHRGPVCGLAFSPDGQRLASCSLDRTVRIWHGSGKELLQEYSLPAAAHAIAFAPDGGMLAVALNDGSVSLVDVHNASAARTLCRVTAPVRAICFLQDGSRFAVGREDGRISLHRFPTGQLVSTLTGHSEAVQSISPAADGLRLITSSSDGTVRTWDVATATQLLPPQKIGYVAISNNGLQLASITASEVSFYIKKGDKPTYRHGLSFSNPQLSALTTSPDGRLWATGHQSGGIHLWDSLTGCRVGFIATPSFIKGLAFVPRTKILACAVGESIKLYHVQTGKLQREIPATWAGARALVVSPDGAWFAAGSNHTTVVWNVRSGKITTKIGYNNDIDALAFSPDGRLLACAPYDGTVSVLLPTIGTLVRKFKLQKDGGAWSLHFSPDGRRLFAAGQYHLYGWDLTTGHRDLFIEQANHPFAVSPCGEMLAACSEQKLGLWNARTGEFIRTITDSVSSRDVLAFASDGKLVLVGSESGALGCWRVADGRYAVNLFANGDEWCAHVPCTPFFNCSDSLEPKLGFAVGAARHPASLWAPIFRRPELVTSALSGGFPDPVEMGMGTYEACEGLLWARRLLKGRTSALP